MTDTDSDPPEGALNHRVRMNIRAEMARQQITQQMLSDRIHERGRPYRTAAGTFRGLTRPRLSELLNGQTKITLDKLGVIADALGVPPTDLLK